MFGFIKEKIKKVYSQFTNKAASIFSGNKLDEEFLHELSNLLLSADTGVKTTNAIIEQLRNDIKSKKVNTLQEAKEELEKLLISHLQQYTIQDEAPKVLLVVGVNGSGKTTFAGKFAHRLKTSGKKVLLVAADTFRAAAIAQLQEWATKTNVEIFIGKENQDPASIVFDVCKKFKQENFDHIIIDTAGRLQTKTNLMNELEKISKVINKVVPEEEINCWLTVDSMLGQNSFQQAKVFNEVTKLNGIILTKLDGTGKGGIVFSITQQLQLPILYVTFGEQLDDIKSFDPKEYVTGLLEE